MMHAQFTPGMTVRSDTAYYYDRPECHIFLTDTTATTGASWSPRHITPADQRIVQTAFVLQNLHNVIFDLGGAKLIFHGRIQPFVLIDCSDIQFRNFAVDYDRYFYTEAEILSVDEKRLRLRVGEEYPFRIADGALVATSATWESDTSRMNSHFIALDPVKKHPLRERGIDLYASGDHPTVRSELPLSPTPIRFEALGGREIAMELGNPAGLRSGIILSIAHEDRRKPVFDATRVQDLEIENIRVHHTGSEIVVAYQCHDLVVRRLQTFLDAESRGLICANADGIHAFHCTGSILIEDCRIENIFDDTVNIHGNYARLVAKTGRCRFTAMVPGAGLSSRIALYRAGDVLRAFRGRTQEALGEFTLAAVNDADIRHLDFSTEEPVDALPEDVLFESLCMPEVTIRRLVTGNKFRGILPASGARTRIEDCFFHQCPVAVNLTGDSNFWGESGPVHDLTIRNCRFLDETDSFAIRVTPEFEPTPEYPYFHHNITIAENRFELASGRVLFARHADHIVWSGNCSTAPEVFDVAQCGHFQCENNPEGGKKETGGSFSVPGR